ncbi:MAG: hypothetical protein RIR90_1682 [Bacteroidota bacterium]|jgi:arginase family enzyme
MSLQTIIDFLDPISIAHISLDEAYKPTQIGQHITVYEEEFPDLQDADLILIGCTEMRGGASEVSQSNSPDKVRCEFYQLFHWHKDVKVADIGNIKTGATLLDTYAALREVLTELILLNKKVLILGGSHDVTMAQYGAYASLKRIIEVSCVDARMDMDTDSLLPADNFLMELFTSEPNFLRHYNHIGFQSYYVHPGMLETIDKLRFDCYRVGKVKEDIQEMEPCIRNSHMLTFDIAAIQHAHAPANRLTPNGFNGEEACTLMQFAGMSNHISTIGLYGYIAEWDEHELTAKQLAHMIWYLMDGIFRLKHEADMEDKSSFNEFTMAFAEVETTFIQSKKTGRWWMRMPDGAYIASNQRDYMIAAGNDIPERWLRAMERM